MISTWQYAVIGTVLNDPSTMEAAGDLLPSDFTGPCVGAWAELINLHNHSAIGTRAFTEALRSSPDFNRFSDAGNPEEFVRLCLSYRGGEITEYVRRVIDESTKRALQRASALIAAEAQRENVQTEDVLDYAENQILSLRRNRTPDGITMADLMSVFLPRIDAIRDGTFQPAWMPNLTAVREVIQFAEKSDFIIIAARPGEGKSAYLRYEALHLALRGKPVAIFNLENDEIDYAKNFIALQAGIDSRKLKDARLLSREELERVSEAADTIRRLPLKLVNSFGASVQTILRGARKAVSEDHATLIQVDYLQLINNGMENRVQDLSMTSQSLKAFTGQMGVPIIAAAQLSRAIETRNADDKEPKLSDLRDSGSLEQDGTIVAFPRIAWTNPSPEEMMSFPENIEPGTNTPRRYLKAVPVQFFVKKNRNGEIGVTAPVKWVKSTGNYLTLQQG